MSSEAYVTCVLSDDLVKSALVLSHSIKKIDSIRPTVVIVGPLISFKLLKELGTSFTYVIRVNLQNTKHDQTRSLLYANPSLQRLIIKYLCWRLTQFSKCVFMDSSMMVLQDLGDVFSRPSFSSAPDISWPDLFNSGFFVYEPSEKTFNTIIDFIGKTSYPVVDDNTIMNGFFSDWHQLDINHRLPYTYNVQIGSYSTYLPALKKYEGNIKAIHFSSDQKPWYYLDKEIDLPEMVAGYIHLWCSAYNKEVEPFVRHVISQPDVKLISETNYNNCTDEIIYLKGNGVELVDSVEDKTKSSNSNISFEEQMNVSKLNWEQGNIDYMGAHSFEQIQKRLDEMRLSQKTSSKF